MVLAFDAVSSTHLDVYKRQEGVRLNAEGDVLLLDQPVVALGELVLQHTGILRADVVEGVLLCRNVDALDALAWQCGNNRRGTGKIQMFYK